MRPGTYILKYYKMHSNFLYAENWVPFLQIRLFMHTFAVRCTYFSMCKCYSNTTNMAFYFKSPSAMATFLFINIAHNLFESTKNTVKSVANNIPTDFFCREVCVKLSLWRALKYIKNYVLNMVQTCLGWVHKVKVHSTVLDWQWLLTHW